MNYVHNSLFVTAEGVRLLSHCKGEKHANDCMAYVIIHKEQIDTLN